MTNDFCRFLSNGYSFQRTNQSFLVKPCCWYRGEILVDENLEQNIKERSKINHWTEECGVCHEQELAGQLSFRQSSFDIIPESSSLLPMAIDINIDMTCNAACVICGPDVSTFWWKQNKKNKIFNIKPHTDFRTQLNFILNSVDLSQVKRIKFFGGEPLLTDTHIKILEKIPNPENCDIWYTTNASILPKKNVIDLWTKFKIVFFEASIDAIGSKFDYIRWPLKWYKIEKNLNDLRDVAPNNLLFRINHTLNPFNILYYNELDSWVKNNLHTNRLGDSTEINIHPCWGAWDLKRTPESLREEIYKKYPGHIVSNILSSLPVESYDTIIKFTETWDPVRKNNWKQAFPEIVKYFPV